MAWAKKGLANNHKICNTSYWTRYGTDDFLESDVMGQGLYFKPFLKHNDSLDPDGWLVRISIIWPRTYYKEVTGAKEGENEAVLEHSFEPSEKR